VVAPIIGATKIAHLEDAVGAVSVKLAQHEVAYLEEPYVPHRIVGHQGVALRKLSPGAE
jgi:1-deoxyxylulose-5-phosphate synthase